MRVRSKISHWIAILSVLAFTSGCYNTHRVETSELEKLNGYQAYGEEPELETKDGKTVDFNSDVLLTFFLAQGGTFFAEYQSVTVDAGRFSGETDEGKSVSYELTEIDEAEVEYLDGKRTGALVISAVVVGGAVVTWALVELVTNIESH